MENTNLKIECHKLNDDGSMVYQPMSNLDGLIWNGVYIIRSFNDNGSWGLPFTLADNEAVNLVVKDQAHRREDATDTQRVVVQTVTRVEKETGEVLTYSRTRRNVNGAQVWSEWSYVTADSTSDIKPNSVSTEKLAAEVREKINNPLRPLYIAAGAEYNDTGADRTRTAPWGETVIHKAGHYYLNGLGDITDKQMMDIYNKGKTLNLEYNLYSYNGRTNLSLLSIDTATSLNGYFYASNCSAEVINLNKGDFSVVSFENTYKSERVFANCSNLKAICGRLVFNQVPHVYIFYNSILLEFVNIYKLKYDLSLATNARISKVSILYMILNSTPTTAITITLHPDAYARLADDAEIVAALEAQPLVSLVSA